jgi:tetratricopeptide (TPR) repeat protein
MRAAILIGVVLLMGSAWLFFMPVFQQPRNVVKNVNQERVRAWESRRRNFETRIRGWQDPERIDEAIATTEAYVASKDRDHLTLDLLVRMHLKKGNKERARELYREILHADPSRHSSTLQQQPDVLVRYAELCRESGDASEADWALARIEGDLSEKYSRAGAYAASAGYKEEAERLLGKAISLQPENRVAQRTLQRVREMKARRTTGSP